MDLKGWRHKMESRYRIQNLTHFVETSNTEEGRQELIKFRKTNRTFKYCRINSIIQAYPSKIEKGIIHENT